MLANLLIDTGAILAILDTRDRWHKVCTDAFLQLRLPALTSEAVLTEVFHLLGRSRIDSEKAWSFLRSGAVQLAIIDHSELTHLHALMTRYRDRPMDFADATLVYLAERESLPVILTVDRSDFSTYRFAGRKRFQILPTEGP
ncbi:MAG TPA: PIN domain-containing protein [Candidatus Acidoferrum sp.]|nr:PIN domain-containing protein [Candidatus Acidoferrum sp.]